MSRTPIHPLTIGLLLLIGVGALIYFISEIKSKLEMKKEEPSTSGEKKPEEK